MSVSISEEFAAFNDRLATFDGPHQLPKRRASSAKKKGVNAAEWPHETPSPEQLARAGFYYKPDADNLDNVACWLCNKNIAGWDANDDPALEHLSHVPDCGWAMNICIRDMREKMDHQVQDPMGDALLASRRATFQGLWPHEKKRGWKCKTEKMVEAGFCYNPTSAGDDNVTCYYCDLALDGWEPKDDPTHEHSKRSPDCAFFSLKDEHAVHRPAPAAKRSKTSRASKASRTSKASRLSTQSSFTAISEAPSVMDIDVDEDDAAAEGDTMLSTATATSKTAKGRKKPAKAKTASTKASRSTRGKKATALDDSQIEATAISASNEAAPEENSPDPEPLPEAAPKTRKRAGTRTNSRKTKDTTVADSSVLEESVLEAPKPKPKRGKKAAASEPVQVEVEAADELALEPEVEAKLELEPAPVPAKKRGKKRTSNGSEKIDSSVMEVDPPAPAVKPKAPARKPRTTKKKSIKESQEDEQAEVEPAVEPQANLEPAPTATKQRESSSKHAGQSTPKRAKAQAVPQPQSSPAGQASDAENQPPSSRPSQDMKQRDADVAYRALTPPVSLSPSKRNIIPGDLSSAVPWSAVDLETVFLPNARLEGMTVESVLQSLTSPEKQMSVEDWIMRNAADAEQKLRDECEQMIGKFESEGVKAIQSLEGIECV